MSLQRSASISDERSAVAAQVSSLDIAFGNGVRAIAYRSHTAQCASTKAYCWKPVVEIFQGTPHTFHKHLISEPQNFILGAVRNQQLVIGAFGGISEPRSVSSLIVRFSARTWSIYVDVYRFAIAPWCLG
jgi:hypothetical protein